MVFSPAIQHFEHLALHSKGNSPNKHPYDLQGPSGPFQQDERLYSSQNTVPRTYTDHRLFSGEPDSEYGLFVKKLAEPRKTDAKQLYDGVSLDNSPLDAHPMDQDVPPQPGPPQSAEISLPEKPPDVYVLDAPIYQLVNRLLTSKLPTRLPKCLSTNYLLSYRPDTNNTKIDIYANIFEKILAK
ncbi:hypothetical protein EYR41_002348 [Orbilia oligospora]|uniref:Uncharacterized protein n=1 Tax=Orbilia oligospora TaxID=2813651 RepID=A0A8H2HD19_ORBOL|nr:hypothetical protein EYR41_002348 [Orbilia oligospora]